MTRSLRMIAAAGALVLMVAASVLAAPSDRARDRMAPVAASHQPSPDAQGETPDEGPPSAELLDKLVSRLRDAGVEARAGQIEALAADYGVGGAVRMLVWAQQSGVSTGDLAGMFDSGMGWGEIAHQLNADNDALSLHPGLGSIMGNSGGNGHGLGRENAPGQQKQAD